MQEAGRLNTRLNPKWTVKMVIFTVVLLGFGVWGTADAFWLYPARGRHHIDTTTKAYLEQLRESGRLLSQASVEDPAAEFERLSKDPGLKSDPEALARYEWLLALSRLHSLRGLTAENRAELDRRSSAGATAMDTRTMFADPSSTLDTLTKELSAKGRSKALEAYDIPLQYVFMALGFGGGVWMIFFLMKCARVKYGYDPSEKRLFLPDGSSFTAAEITEVDKRDWHKYFLYLKISGSDRERKFDLLRYAPLEDWLEEMRKQRPGYDPSEDKQAEEPAAEAPVAEATAGDGGSTPSAERGS